jgi:hypothetical protein
MRGEKAQELGLRVNKWEWYKLAEGAVRPARRTTRIVLVSRPVSALFHAMSYTSVPAKCRVRNVIMRCVIRAINRLGSGDQCKAERLSINIPRYRLK